MNTNIIKKEVVMWLILLLPFIYLIFIWDKLPEQIPTHWNAEGEIDDYSSKAFGSLLLPCINLFIYLTMIFLPKIDPRKKNYQLFSGPYYIFRILILSLTTALFFITIRMSMGDQFDYEKIIFATISLFFIIFGNYMGNIRPNWFVGIRTPWTMDNEEVWRKTHQLAGKLWFSGGIAALIFSFVLTKYFNYWFIPLLFTITLIPIIYSYLLYKKIVSDKKYD